MPDVNKGEVININRIDMLSKETLPPKRFTPASIIRELEKRNLGTKATRSEIVETLFKRGYVYDESIKATVFGIKTIEALEKHSPAIVDEELTRHFEIELEEIRDNKKKKEDVLKEAKGAITTIIKEFKRSQKEIGIELLNANNETRNSLSLLGRCPNCNTGEIHLRRSKKGSFAACNKYPDCKTIYSLPRNLAIKSTGKKCEKCNAPVIQFVRNRRKHELCINQNCETKHIPGDSDRVNTLCPTCKQGNLIMRNSIYGSFLACSSYPKCKHTESLVKKKD